MQIPVLTDHLIKKLGILARNASPNEVVGLILESGQILQLPNRSMSPQGSFEVHAADVKLAIELLDGDLSDYSWGSFTLWHSHPSGGVGPSRIDMQNKLPGLNHLVITLAEDGEVIPTWY